MEVSESVCNRAPDVLNSSQFYVGPEVGVTASCCILRRRRKLEAWGGLGFARWALCWASVGWLGAVEDAPGLGGSEPRPRRHSSPAPLLIRPVKAWEDRHR